MPENGIRWLPRLWVLKCSVFTFQWSNQLAAWSRKCVSFAFQSYVYSWKCKNYRKKNLQVHCFWNNAFYSTRSFAQASCEKILAARFSSHFQIREATWSVHIQKIDGALLRKKPIRTANNSNLRIGLANFSTCNKYKSRPPPSTEKSSMLTCSNGRLRSLKGCFQQHRHSESTPPPPCGGCTVEFQWILIHNL